uniref:transposase n=1 Tax=Gordonia amicalis TaxID=89053 RepID=UPI001B34AF49|nr:transposase [Gordonia amicalis]
MPPSMREWLAADDPVWLVIETVAALDTSGLHAKRKTGGVGRAGYDPDMLLTLLIWGWAHGQRSSRQLERLCQRDVAYRIICAGDAPDHVTISRFRADCTDVVEDLFTQVLALCARVGMGQLGVVALDGVKIASNASTSANRTADGLWKALAAEAARASAEHAAIDAAEDDQHGPGRGDQLPPELADHSSRRARIAQALAQLPAATDAAEVEAHTRRVAGGEGGRYPIATRVEALTASWHRARAVQQAKIDRYRPGQRGPRPVAVDDHLFVRRARARLDHAIADRDRREKQAARSADARVAGPRRNITDPQSRLMPLRGGGWVQGYNCQAVTSEDGLIIATGVNNNNADVVAFADMFSKAIDAAELIDAHHHRADGIGVLLADAGYLSDANLTMPGPDRLIAIGKSREIHKTARTSPTHGQPPPDATPVEAMAHRLATEEGHRLYSKRSHIAETPFGHAKHNLGFKRFTGRGIDRATAEFSFHGLVHNLMKAIGTGYLNPATT